MTMAGMFGHGGGTATADTNRAFKQQLNKVYGVHEGDDE